MGDQDGAEAAIARDARLDLLQHAMAVDGAVQRHLGTAGGGIIGTDKPDAVMVHDLPPGPPRVRQRVDY
ncbi:hypothetical protein D3C78_1934780 [compost metagenome]